MIETTTFLDLLRQGGVLIPRIRRDYAQGRPQKPAQELRDRFLEALHHALTNREGLIWISSADSGARAASSPSTGSSASRRSFFCTGTR